MQMSMKLAHSFLLLLLLPAVKIRLPIYQHIHLMISLFAIKQNQLFQNIHYQETVINYGQLLRLIYICNDNRIKVNTLSTVVFCLTTIFAVPISPLVENFTPSFVTEITTMCTNQPKALASQKVHNETKKQHLENL